MKKAFPGLLLALIGVILLSACDQLTRFTISEQEANQALEKHNHYQKQLNVAGLVDASITLSDLKAAIGREEPGKVTLSGKATIHITSLFGPQQAQVQLKMKTQPVFNPQQGAIYLQDLEITDARVEPEKLTTLITTLTPYLSQSLKNYFSQQPAWTLSSDRSQAEALARRYAKGLEVKPGELVIRFGL